MADMITLPMFDKIINVRLFRGDRNKVEIVCPAEGRKPTIRLSGDLLSQTMMQQMELRITNFVTDVPLSEYTHRAGQAPGSGNHVEIEAGYRGSLRAAMYGEVMNAYQETPGPDGVTAFQCFVGYFTDWTTRTLTASFDEGTPLSIALGKAAEALGMSLLYYADPSLALKAPVSCNGLAKELIWTLRRMFAEPGPTGDWSGVMIRPDGQNLIVTNRDLGTGLTYRLDYVSMVNHNAAGFNVQAPWIPSIRPDDDVQIDPKYFRQDFGGALVPAGNTFRVIRVTFDFCTTDQTNMMTLVTVDRASIKRVHTPAIPETLVAPMRGM